MDYGKTYADKAERALELRFQRAFTEAQSDVLKKLDAFTAKYEKKDKAMRERLAKGEIDQEKYDRWVAGQVFQGAQWEQKVKDIDATLLDYYEDALAKTYDKQIDVFSENANYQAYCMEHEVGKDFGFDIYDRDTVERLVKDSPELLPRKIADKKKHNHWNQGIINNCITQGVIQGESIPKIAKRIANATANHNNKSATLYARTAMTSAQNGGRMQMLNEAKEKGINVKKQWLATNDGRTRDSHIHLNGQIKDVDKPFKSDFGRIEYPGDPKAHPADVYNCRCTLVYVFPEYEDMSKYPDWEEAKTMTYPEWKDAKSAKNSVFTTHSGRNIINTGGHNADVTKPNVGWQEAHAQRYYRSIAHQKEYTNADVIAKQTGHTTEEIEQVRKHIFVNTHDFGNGEVHRFNPSYEQSIAWQRLSVGEGTDTDFLLVDHELYESNLENSGMSIDQAHALANKKYGWWRKRSEELNGGDDYIAEIPND